MKHDAIKILRICIFSLFFLSIILYAFFRSRDLILGVKIKDVMVNGTLVENYSTFSNSIINITGNAVNAIHLTLDGREISINQKGDFTETLALLPGYNIINIEAIDKFGKTDKKDYKLTYKQQ